MNITQHASPNKYNGRNGWVPDMIVCHIAEGSYGGTISWLSKPSVEASAHFVVGRDGSVAQLVQLTDAAWGNGTNNDESSSICNSKSKLQLVRDRKVNANFYTISIEHEGKYGETHGALTDAQKASTIELIAFIRSEVKRLYGTDVPLDREHIVGHCDIVPVAKPYCPGEAFPFDEIIAALQNSTPQPTPAPAPAEPVVQKPQTMDKHVSTEYRVKTQKHGWLPPVTDLNDYAGYEDSPIIGVAIGVSDGSLRYRVHINGGDWLPHVTGYDINDYLNGFAGNDQIIDTIEVYYNTPDSIRPYKKAKYRVAPCGRDYYSWQLDNDTDNGQDGYAGMFGQAIGKFQIEIV